MSQAVETIGNDIYDRQICYLNVAEFRTLPSKYDLPSVNFVLFLACDAAGLPVDEIYDWAYEIINNGLSYVCLWGEDCERVHDIIDEAIVMREIESGIELPLIMTTWHTNDTLDEALWFALYNTLDDDFPDSNVVLVANVGDGERDINLRKRLADLEELNAVVVSTA